MGKDHITSRVNNISEWILDDRVRHRLAGSGFDTIGNFTVQLRNNLALIRALLSSYDVTKHCFSFGVGDVSVYLGLEDILFITGFPIDGKPITGNEYEPSVVCEKLLGVNKCITRERKNGKVTHTSNVSLDWLKEKFMKIPKDVDEQGENFPFYVRAYVLYVIGCVIAPHSGKQVSVIYLPLLEDIDTIKDYAWGASLLATLHWTFSKSVKADKELTGFVYALMIFALERIPRVAKKLGFEAAQVKTTKMDYPLFVGWSNLICERTRDNYKERSESEWKTILDGLMEEDIEWKPYQRLPSDYLSEFLRSQAILGMSRTVLLCFEKVVYHRPDVSPRQFGLGNDFVCRLSDLIEIRPTERSGNNKKDWSSWGKYKLYNEEWGKRYNLLIKPREEAGTPQCTELWRSRGEGLSPEGLAVAAEKLQAEYECQKRELTETRRALEKLKIEYECKNKECQEAWKSLKDLQNELMRKSMHVGSLAFAIEGQVKEKSRWFSSMRDLKRKLKLLKMDQISLSEEALSYKKCLVDMNDMRSIIESKLKEQVELHNDIKLKFIKGAKERKELYNKILELKGNIRVFCRCRPFNIDEIAAGASMAMDLEAAKDGELTVKSNGAPKKTFKFDAIFGPQSNQVDVFEDTAPFATSVLDGYNVCIFAYGQTGTGKTFTMEGTEGARGVNFRTLEQLFHIIKERKGEYQYELSVSVLEVYNEQIRDLLVPGTQTGVTTKRLEIRQVGEGIHHVPGLVEAHVNNMSEVWEVLQTGSNARAVGSTNVNEHSSRSHCIHCVMVKGENLLNGECTRSKLWLVDLAGSERVAKTEVQGERLKETQNINRSLSALGDVISALATKSPHIPFRNSKLTHLLQDSLGGDSKTLMFVQISPNENDLSETICSLNFASRVRGIELGPAKKQLDSTELLKYKQLAEKTKLDVKSKDVQIKKMEDTIYGLDVKMKDKDLKNKLLQDKIKELESQLLIERRLARQHVDSKILEQQQLVRQQQQEEQNSALSRPPLANRPLGVLKNFNESKEQAVNHNRQFSELNSNKLRSPPPPTDAICEHNDPMEKENNPANADQLLAVPKRTGRASLCPMAQRILPAPAPRRASLIPLPIAVGSTKFPQTFLQLPPIQDNKREETDIDAKGFPEPMKWGGNSPKELKSGGKKLINSILRRSVQKRVQIRSPMQQHIRRGGGVNVGMEKVRVSIGSRGRVAHRVLLGNARRAVKEVQQQKESHREKERGWNSRII